MSGRYPDTKIFPVFLKGCWILLFASFICSWRAVTSVCIFLLLICALIENRNQAGRFFRKIISDPFVIGCALFFLLQVIALAYTDNTAEGWKNIRLKSGLLLIPLAFCNTDLLPIARRKKLFSYFCLVLCSASLYCLLAAGWQYVRGHDSSVFFYHRLVNPFSQHAVYFSIYVSVAVVYLLENIRQSRFLFNRSADISLVLFFSLFIFLLSSKLVIILYGLYLLYYFIMLLRKNTTHRILVLVLFILFIGTGAAALALPNPVSKRFYEIAAGDMKLIGQDKFDQGDYFNGLQFRLLEWRFVAEILSTRHYWLFGASPGDAQLLLDQQYISKHMYTGGVQGRGKGFLGYNTHNQFLEALLETGIAGLVIFLFINFCLIRMAVQSGSRFYRFIILLLIMYSFSESVFETQYGILLYTFFPLFTRPGTAQLNTF